VGVIEPEPWQALDEEIAQWAAPPALWLRDDDATGPAPAVATLLNACAVGRVPVCLAVIPSSLDPEFFPWLASQAASTTVVPHGLGHTNHAPEGQKKSEFGDHRSLSEISKDLRDGLHRVQDAFGVQARPIFVPPWNHFGSIAGAALIGAGYTALSAKTTQIEVTGIAVIDVHIDIIDWRGSRGYGGDGPILGALRKRLAALRVQGKEKEPTGILTHHAVHDPAAWTFLETLFSRLGSKVGWLNVDDVARVTR
jgi:hypothetical protein